MKTDIKLYSSAPKTYYKANTISTLKISFVNERKVLGGTNFSEREDLTWFWLGMVRNFYEFHKLAIDELEAFNYEEFKVNGFKINKLVDYDLSLDFDKKPE